MWGRRDGVFLVIVGVREGVRVREGVGVGIVVRGDGGAAETVVAEDGVVVVGPGGGRG